MSDAAVALAEAEGVVSIATSAASGDNQWVIIVDVVMLSLTLIGASGILLNMAYNEFYLRRAAAVRMRLVQALVISDFLLGISALVPSVTKLRMQTVHHGTPFCDGFGFVLVAAVFGEHCWTLVLAIATYMILCHPLHAVTRLLDRQWIWLYLVVWGICIGFALLGFELYGYWPSGGICYYGSNAGLYSELVQFIPRGIVFVIVIVIYSRLHSFLKRPDRIKGSFSNSRNTTHDKTGQTSSGDYEIGGIPMHGDGHGQVVRDRRDSGKGKLPSRDKLMAGFRRFSFGPGGAKAEFEEKEDERVGTEMGEVDGARSRGANGSASPPDGSNSPPESEVTQVSDRTPVTNAIPPWERIELPAFQIGDTRYGGSPANLRDSQSHFLNWKGMGKANKTPGPRGSRSGSAGTEPETSSYTRQSASSAAARRDRRRTNELGSVGSISGRPITPNGALVGFGMRPNARSQETSPTIPDTGDSAVLGSPTNSTTFDGRRESADEPGSLIPAARRHPGPINLSQTHRHSIVSPYPSPLGTTQTTNPLAYPLDTLPALSTSGSISTYHTGSIPSVTDTLPYGGREILIRRDSGVSGSDAEYARRGSGPVTFALPPAKFADLLSEKRRGSFPTSSSRRSSVDEGTLFPPSQLGEKSRLNDVEAQRVQAEAAEDDSDEEMDLARMLADSYEENHQPSFSRRRISDESEDWQQESMASYMNRKTAMLMLYFPIAYVVLFSVSLVRLIYDFSTTTKEPLALTAISRWLVFAQGLVDAAIYGGIEWKTKRAVRRKIRRGQLSPSDSRTGSRGSLAAEMYKASTLRRHKGTTSTTQMEGDETNLTGSSIPQGESTVVSAQ